MKKVLLLFGLLFVSYIVPSNNATPKPKPPDFYVVACLPHSTQSGCYFLNDKRTDSKIKKWHEEGAEEGVVYSFPTELTESVVVRNTIHMFVSRWIGMKRDNNDFCEAWLKNLLNTDDSDSGIDRDAKTTLRGCSRFVTDHLEFLDAIQKSDKFKK